MVPGGRGGELVILMLGLALAAREEGSAALGLVVLPAAGLVLRLQNPEQPVYLELSGGFHPRQTYVFGSLTLGRPGGFFGDQLVYDPQIGAMVTFSPSQWWDAGPAWSLVFDPIALRWRPDDGHLRPRVAVRVGATKTTDEVLAKSDDGYFGMDTLYFGLSASMLVDRRR